MWVAAVRELAPATEIRQYISQVLTLQPNFLLMQFLNNDGREYLSAVDPKRYGLPRNCYHNAYRLAMRDKAMTYCEGLGLNVIPTMHAWCVDREGHVVDPTWLDGGKAYFGVTFNLDYVRRMRLKRRLYGVIEGNHALICGVDTDWRG